MFLEWPLPKLLKWFCLDEKAIRAKNRKKLWMPSPPSYGCCTRVNFVFKKHLLLQMNLSNYGLKNRSIKKFWLIFPVLKFPLGLQFSHNLSKFKIIKYISTIIHHDNYMYIFTTVNSGERCGPWASCLFLFFASHLIRGWLLKKRICSHRSKFFPLRVDPFLKNFILQRSKQEVMKVVPLFSKIAENHRGVPIHCKHSNPD